MLQRVKSFISHLQREDHVDDDLHQSSLPSLEAQFHDNNFGPPENIHLAVHPVLDKRRRDKAPQGAEAFRKAYESDTQFVFSRFQHHWHFLDEEGVRRPMRYCQMTGRKKHKCCKRGFPKTVQKSIEKKSVVARIICKGVAHELDLKVSGRRNMLGACVPRRRCPWFASTSCLLAHLFRCNSNVQCTYRLPINSTTHDPGCARNWTCKEITV